MRHSIWIMCADVKRQALHRPWNRWAVQDWCARNVTWLTKICKSNICVLFLRFRNSDALITETATVSLSLSRPEKLAWVLWRSANKMEWMKSKCVARYMSRASVDYRITWFTWFHLHKINRKHELNWMKRMNVSRKREPAFPFIAQQCLTLQSKAEHVHRAHADKSIFLSIYAIKFCANQIKAIKSHPKDEWLRLKRSADSKKKNNNTELPNIERCELRTPVRFHSQWPKG